MLQQAPLRSNIPRGYKRTVCFKYYNTSSILSTVFLCNQIFSGFYNILNAFLIILLYINHPLDQ